MINFNLGTYLAQNTAGVGVLGAIVGGSVAGAKAISAHRRGLIDRRSAVTETGKEAAGAGVATAVSVVAAGVVGGGLLLSLGTALAAATAAKYAWDRGVDRVGAVVAARAEEKTPPAKPTRGAASAADAVPSDSK